MQYLNLKDPFRDEPDGPVSDSIGWSNPFCCFRQGKKDLLIFLKNFEVFRVFFLMHFTKMLQSIWQLSGF